jgi:hypothetical protein
MIDGGTKISGHKRYPASEPMRSNRTKEADRANPLRTTNEMI